MGCGYSPNIQHEPCDNCGKEDGIMSSSEWLPQWGKVCGRACGERMTIKYKNGMYAPPENASPFRLMGAFDMFPTRSPVLPFKEASDERIQIKILANKVKQLKNRVRELENEVKH